MVWLWMLLCLASAGAHRCAYQPPRPGDVIVSHRRNSVNRRARSLSDKFHIHTVFDRSVTKDLPQNLSIHVKDFLIPHAMEYWTKNLRLKGGGINGITLERGCISHNEYLWGNRRVCTFGCLPETKCGEAVIPDHHLYPCLSRKIVVNTSPIRQVMTNFILYITAFNSTRCNDMATVAYAVHCQQDSTKRPIAGNVNICPASLSTRPHDQELLISTIKHEIAHALVFSDALFKDFPRNPIRTIKRDWPMRNGHVVQRRHHVIASPRVAEEVQRHFNCSNLLGAELEDQGGYGTSMVHWEKRIFENEAMTGTHTQNPVYSRITLALFEDSGWYDVSYESAEDFMYGKNLGCDFVQMTCGEWIRTRQEQGLSIMPFCQAPKHDGLRSLAVTSCTSERNALSFCNLIPYEEELIPYYQYFEHLNGISDAKVSFYGGSVELADYCPFYQAFAWRDPAADQPFFRDSRCSLDINTPTVDSNPIMEVYGNSSKCFDLLITWTERKCGRVKTFSQNLAGCYEYTCKKGRVNVRVAGSSSYYPCYHEGQHIHINQIINGWLRQGIIVCPSCDEICGADDEPDFCGPEQEPPHKYIGDEPLVEPCAANSQSIKRVFLIMSFIFLLRHIPVVQTYV
ncbi:unnamed protein product [Bursaphelenchus xylophilus]|uniref:Leishmanolysin-like peptidase n=1 Tax=Bursaphelenchus xylophilus TaxID=6326 RepID=A0A1I7ST82_BURXY|nr:unnamed protein product [Bursaphelenchus xylophilus]CAG9108655.1 unnamed protein product [Bursaphelenchus xylophilus]